MSTIVTRASKGLPLSHGEMDTNLTNLNTDKLEASALVGLITASSTDTLTNKTVNLSSNTLVGTLSQFNTAVSDADLASVAGTETLTNKTINLTNNTLTGTAAQFNAAVSDADFVTSGGALGTPSSGTLTNCTFPTLNQNTTGSAASVSGTTTTAISASALGSGTADSTTYLRGDRTWATVAAGGVTSVGGNTGAVTNAQLSASVAAALGYTPANPASYVAKDNGYGAIGTFCLAMNGSGIGVAAGGTIAGSSLRAPDLNSAFLDAVATGQPTFAGTWRNMGGAVGTYSGSNMPYGCFQRIS